MDTKAALLIILYNPKESDFAHLQKLASLYDGVVVDNSSQPLPQYSIGRFKYHCFGQNRGIAFAHNYGLRIIMQDPTITHVVILDQDSRVPTQYIPQIISYFQSINHEVGYLAALGPTIIQKYTQEVYQSAIFRDQYLTPQFIKRNEIIASGACISIEAFRNVGLEDERLFIDFVDSEWCFRAWNKGWKCGITPCLQLKHMVGRGELHIGSHIISLSAPFRYYYQYRNLLLLWRRKYVPIRFKINWTIKFILRFLYFPLFVNKGWQCWKFMYRGIWHGIMGKTGIAYFNNSKKS